MFEILKYKPINRGALAGSFDLKIPKWGGFVIRQCNHFVKGEAHWFTFPCRAYEEDGVQKYYSYNLFDTPEMMKAFSERVVPAIKDYLIQNRENMQDASN